MNIASPLVLASVASKILVFVAMVFFTAFFIADYLESNLWNNRHSTSKHLRFRNWLRLKALCLFPLCVLYFFSTTTIPLQTMFIDKNGKVAAVFPKGTVMWTWKYRAFARGKTQMDYGAPEIQIRIPVRPGTGETK